jgi:dienelactone hydrolase
MDDALSGLKYLQTLPYVDARDVGAVGHSFGGSLTVLLAEREPNLRAIIVFSGAGYSFDRSPALRARLLTAIDRIAVPVFFIHAENDYSLSSGKVLDARRQQIGKPHRLKIYPPIGQTVEDGHDFLHLGVKRLGARRVRLFGREHAEVSMPADRRGLRNYRQTAPCQNVALLAWARQPCGSGWNQQIPRTPFGTSELTVRYDFPSIWIACESRGS